MSRNGTDTYRWWDAAYVPGTRRRPRPRGVQPVVVDSRGATTQLAT